MTLISFCDASEDGSIVHTITVLPADTIIIRLSMSLVLSTECEQK